MGYSIFDETMVNMTWPEIEAAAGRGAIVIMPVGIIEEHGPHMGLAVDINIACLVSFLARRRLEKDGIRALIAPPQYWGVSAGTATFGGTFSVRPETMKAIVYDIISCLCGWRLKRVFTVNCHGDYRHGKAVLEAVQEARRDKGAEAYCVLPGSDARRMRLAGNEDYIIVQQDVPQGEVKKYIDLHAGSLETGIIAGYFPEQVDIKLAMNLKATELTFDDLKGLGRSDAETRKLIPGGYFGDPAGYDIKSAQKYIEECASSLADAIENHLKADKNEG